MTSKVKDTQTPVMRHAVRQGRGLLVWAFVFSVFVNLLMLTGPLYMLAVYDQVLTSGSVDVLRALTFLVLALFALMAVLDYARGRVMARYGARFQTALDAPVFERVLSRSTDPKTRAHNTHMIRHLDAVQGLFLSPALIAVMDMPWAPLFIAAIFFLHPMLGWLALAGGVSIVGLTVINQLTTARSTRLAQIKSQQSHRFVAEVLDAHDVVLGQGMNRNIIQRHTALRTAAQRQYLNTSDWMGLFASGSKSFRLFLQSAILGLGAYFVIKGQLTPGAMIAASILLGRALAPIELTLSNWTVLQRARAGWAALSALFAVEPDQPASSADQAVPKHLHVEALCVTPPNAKSHTVRDLGFRLEPGQILGVIGPSGSGKSTLARALTGVWPAASGTIRFAGKDLDQYAPEDLGALIGYLPQTVQLFSGTVAENIRRMSPETDMRGVMDAAKRAQAHGMIMDLPGGYDTYLDGNDSLLSGGQRQRVALARALYGDPALLVLDEPNSMLDVEGSEALNTTIRQFKETGKSVILMTHRPQAITECDLLLVIEKGTVSTLGPRGEVMEKTYPNIRRIKGLAARKALK